MAEILSYFIRLNKLRVFLYRALSNKMILSVLFIVLADADRFVLACFYSV